MEIGAVNGGGASLFMGSLHSPQKPQIDPGSIQPKNIALNNGMVSPTANVSLRSSNTAFFKNGVRHMTSGEQRELKNLRDQDRMVREHEEAHRRVGGTLTGAPSYITRTGPDGHQYAVQGTVQINATEGNTPEETIRNAQTIKRAAMAPRNPSPQDRQAALAADRMEKKARTELLEKRKNAVASRQNEMKDRANRDPDELRINGKPVKTLGYTKIFGMKVEDPEIENNEGIRLDKIQAFTIHQSAKKDEAPEKALNILA